MRLDPDDIEAIAQRVAELTNQPRAPEAVRLVDAQAVAKAIGVDREWVYAHAGQLGAIRLGGARGRLRFDLHEVRRALSTPPRTQAPQAPRPTASRRRGWTGSRVDLLPYES